MICIETGTYEEDLTIDKPLTLAAKAGHEPVLDGDRNYSTAILVDSTENVTIDGLAIHDYVSHGIQINDSEGVSVTNTEISEFVSAVLLDVHRSSDLLIEENTVQTASYASAHGIRLNQTTGSTITGNDVSHNEWGNIRLIESDSNVVSNNNLTGTGIHVRLAGSSNVNVVDNRIGEYGGSTGISLGYSPNDDSIPAADNVIRGNEVTTPQGTSPAILLATAPRTTVEDNVIHDGSGFGVEIVDAATDSVIRNNDITDRGGGVRLHSAENVTFDANRIAGSHDDPGIEAANATDLSIENNDLYDNHERGIGFVDEVGSDVDPDSGPVVDAVVRNNTLAGHDIDLDLYAASGTIVDGNSFETGVVLRAQNASYLDHSFTENTVGGDPVQYVYDEDDPRIEPDAGQVIVSGSTNVEVTDMTFDGVASGVQIAFSPGAVVDNVTVTNGPEAYIHDSLRPSRWYAGGVVLIGSHGARVSNSTTSDNALVGIGAHGSDYIELSNNTAIGNDWAGVRTTNSNASSIVDNTISDSKWSGTGDDGIGIHAQVERDGPGPTIAGNTLSDNDVGIFMDTRRGDLHDWTVRENQIQHHAVAGILIEDAIFNVTIRDNDIQRNAYGIDQRFAEPPVNVTHNWWGHPSGPSGGQEDLETGSTAAGDGDEIRGADDLYFDPWRDTPRNDYFDVQITNTSDPIVAGDTLDVEFSVENIGEEAGSQRVTLETAAGTVVDETTVSLEPDRSTSRTLQWDSSPEANTSETLTVRTEQATDETEVAVYSEEPPEACDTVLVEGEDLQNAVDVASVGETVCLSPGTYEVHEFTIDESITLRAFDREDPPVIEETETGVNAEPVITLAGASSVTLDALVISDNTDDAISATEVSDLTITGLEIDGTDGIQIEDATTLAITGSELTAVDWNGIDVAGSVDVTIDNTEINGTSRHGIALADSTDVFVTRNHVQSADSAALYAENWGDVRVEENTFIESEYGVEAWNGQDESSELTITSNLIGDNHDIGIQVEDVPGTIQVVDNEITGNEVAGVVNFHEEGDVNATENWWGDVSGPSGVVQNFGLEPGEVEDPVTGEPADGAGDAVGGGDGLGDVRFDPWVSELDEPPTASFVHEPAEPTTDDQVTFDASASSGPEPLEEYRWDVTGDGTFEYIEEDPVVTHVYDDADDYEVTLEVEDAVGNTDAVTETVSVEPPPNGTLELLVTDEWSDEPVDGADIWVLNVGAEPEEEPTGTTEQDGTFGADTEPGTYDVWVDHPVYDEEVLESVEVESGFPTSVNVTMEPTTDGAITGTVTDATTDEEIEDADVDLYQDGEFFQSAETDEDGVYTFDGLLTDTYDVAADATGYEPVTVEDIVVEGELVPVNASLEPLAEGAINGTVTEAHTDDPLEGATVALFENETLLDQVETGAAGSYLFEELEVGTYDLLFNADGYHAANVTSIDVAEDTVERNASLEVVQVQVTIVTTHTPVVEGETLTVIVDVTNELDEPINETIELRNSDGDVLDEEIVSFDGAGLERIALAWETEIGDAGTHSLAVAAPNDTEHTTASVEEFVPATFTIDSVTPDVPAFVDEPFAIDVDVENEGTESETATVELLDGDTLLSETSTSIEGGSTETVTITWTPGDDDVGEHEFTIDVGNDTETLPVTVEEPHLGIAHSPSQPAAGEIVWFHADHAEDPTWDFGDGETAQGTLVFHEFQWEVEDVFFPLSRTVTVTDVDGTEESFNVTVSMPPVQGEIMESLVFTTLDREHDGYALSGVSFEETFTWGVDALGSDGEIEEIRFDLGDETVTTDPERDGLFDVGEATFDLGELDGDTELEMRATTSEGTTYTGTEMVRVVETPGWLESALEEHKEVDTEAGTVTTELTLAQLTETFGLGDLPLDGAGDQLLMGDTVAVVTYQMTEGAGQIDGEGAFETSIVGADISAETDVEGALDSELAISSAEVTAYGELSDFTPPGLGVNADVPFVGEISVGLTVNGHLGADGELDEDLAIEEATVDSSLDMTVGASLDIICEIYLEVFGGVAVQSDIPDPPNTRGEATLGIGGGVDCGLFDGSFSPSYTHEFGGGLDPMTMDTTDESDDDIEWELSSKYGERPFADETATLQTLDVGSNDRLTDRDLEDTQPAIAAVGDEYVVVWSAQDEEKNVTDGRDLLVSTANASTLEWSEPEQLTDDNTSDEAPALAAGEHGLLAVWSTLNGSVDPGEVDGPGDVFPEYEIAYAIDDGTGWSEPTVLTDTDEKQFRPDAVTTDDGWTIAWETVHLEAENVTGGDVQYVTLEEDGGAGTVETIEGATLPSLGLREGTATLAYATVDEGDADRLTEEVVTEEIDAGERTELHSHSATNVTDLATDAGRTVWVDGFVDQSLQEGDGQGVTDLEVRDEVRTMTELVFQSTTDGTVLSYRAEMAGEFGHDLVYRLDPGDGWVYDREHVAIEDDDHTAWRADVAPAIADTGIVTAYAIRQLDHEAVDDVFVTEHDFRPAFSLEANATGAAMGEESTIQYELRNVGDIETAGEVTVVVENATGTVANRTHGPIEAGATGTETLELPVDEYGTFELSLEHDEDVHDATETVTVVVAHPGLSVGVVGGELVDDDTALLEATIENEGDAVATDVPVAFDDGTGTVATATAERISPGENVTVNATVDPDDLDSSVTDSVVIDPDGELDEASLESPTRPTWFLRPDLIVGGAEYHENAGTVTADVLVANDGTLTVDATVTVLDDAGEVLGTANETLERATNVSSDYALVPVEVGDVADESITILVDSPVPDADPGSTGLTDDVTPVYQSDRPRMDVAISNVSEPSSVADNLVVDVEIVNRGEVEDEQPVTLSIDGTAEDEVAVSLPGGFSTTETLTYDPTETDDRIVELQVATLTDHDERILGLEFDPPMFAPLPPEPEPEPLEPATFELETVDVPADIDADEQFAVTVVVSNTGEMAGTTTVNVSADDVVLNETNVTLEGGENTSVEFELTAEDLEEGEVALSVAMGNDTTTSTLVVSPVADDEEVETDDEETDDDRIPGLGVVGMLVALGLVLLREVLPESARRNP